MRNSALYALRAGWPPRWAYSTVESVLMSPGANEIDEGGHGLPLVDGVQNDALQPAGQPHGVQGRGDRDAVRLTGPALEHIDLVVAEVTVEADQCGGVAGDLLHLGARLGDLCRRVDTEHAARPILSGKPGDHAGMGAAGNGAHDDRVEVDAKLLLLLMYLVGPVREPQST